MTILDSTLQHAPLFCSGVFGTLHLLASASIRSSVMALQHAPRLWCLWLLAPFWPWSHLGLTYWQLALQQQHVLRFWCLWHLTLFGLNLYVGLTYCHCNMPPGSGTNHNMSPDSGVFGLHKHLAPYYYYYYYCVLIC